MLYPLIESSLPGDTLRAWQGFRAINRGHRETESSESNDKKESTHRMDLDGLLLFLLDEIEGEERVSIATKCFTKYQSPKPWNTKHVGFKNRGEFTQTSTASTLIATSEQNPNISNESNRSFCRYTNGISTKSLYPKDKDYLRFLCYGNDGKLKYYRHCRVVFGVTSSHFLLVSVIQYLLESTLKELNGILSISATNITYELPGILSKREISAITHKVFDPLGIACPVTLIPKLLLQRLWKLKLSWDQEVDSNSMSEFCKWMNDLKHLEKLEIPKWLNCDFETENVSLHFCDASKLAYSAVAFIRVQTRDSVQVHLLQAKARVAPSGRKETTIARLEILGATICAHLASSIIKEFETVNIYF
ncbi:hypothetical protein AVEN_192597-1 [Araneus ventricosus]|uniref:Uncharacterized protein n=1 Tax=Araneus ventricosus TaxID=182803 RepID=A0A4Y2J8F9_ARAVE|nr:hypothetical protein AVEN_192597-1 [Araneus ventricosus]